MDVFYLRPLLVNTFFNQSQLKIGSVKCPFSGVASSFSFKKINHNRGYALFFIFLLEKKIIPKRLKHVISY
jgi:hypothetical protein